MQQVTWIAVGAVLFVIGLTLTLSVQGERIEEAFEGYINYLWTFIRGPDTCTIPPHQGQTRADFAQAFRTYGTNPGAYPEEILELYEGLDRCFGIKATRSSLGEKVNPTDILVQSAQAYLGETPINATTAKNYLRFAEAFEGRLSEEQLPQDYARKAFIAEEYMNCESHLNDVRKLLGNSPKQLALARIHAHEARQLICPTAYRREVADIERNIKLRLSALNDAKKTYYYQELCAQAERGTYTAAAQELITDSEQAGAKENCEDYPYIIHKN